MATDDGQHDPQSSNTLIQKNAMAPSKQQQQQLSTFLWAGLAIDVILFVLSIVILVNTGGSARKAGGAYAWAKTLLALTGVSLIIVALLGLTASVGAICASASIALNRVSKSVLLVQVITMVVVMLIQILALGLFFSFFGALQNSPSQTTDVKYPVFSNFANCTWNTCCAMTHVRERSFVKLDCNVQKTGVSDLKAVCLNLPRQSSNASACVGGDGLVHFRKDLSSWIFAEVMSWSWIVATLLIFEAIAFFVYGLRWNSVRLEKTKR
jgi:hypothetical protein